MCEKVNNVVLLAYSDFRMSRLCSQKRVLCKGLFCSVSLLLRDTKAKLNHQTYHLLFQVTSEQRLESVKQACRKTQKSWDSLSLTEKRILVKHILVNDEHKFLFCAVPKVASSNWKRVLMVLEGEAINSEAIKDEAIQRGTFKNLGDSPPLEVERKVRKYYKFMFVREPLLRLVSAYKDKFVLNNTYFHERFGIKIVKHMRQNAPVNSKGDDVLLKEFLQYITASRVEDMNEHWMPFFELCQPCAVSYNFIGSFENLNADSNNVLEDLHVNEKVSFPKQQKHQAGGKGHTSTVNLAGVSSKLLTKVLTKYSKDYEMFSYQTPHI